MMPQPMSSNFVEPEQKQSISQLKVQDSITEVDEDPILEAESQKTKLLSHKDYCQSEVMRLWASYDFENIGELDKIETTNFVCELLNDHELPTPSLDLMTTVFENFDPGNEGVIAKKDMTEFVMLLVAEHKYSSLV